MDRIDRKIDDKSDWLFNQLREMEGRICTRFDEKIVKLEENTEYKVNKAKDIEDERLKRIDEQHREHERRLDRIDQESYRDYSHNRTRRRHDEETWGVGDDHKNG
jgi:hypothetical protein